MENNNSVCYVGTITEIKSIEGADNIELAIVGGWNCIVPRNEYGPGGRVIIATTDAVIPESISNEMGVTSYLRKGNRVRTVKLRGVYSECLIIPTQFAKQQYLKDGDDKMSELGIHKYEPPVKQITLSSGRKIKYQANPSFQVYYKFPNLKNVPDLFKEGDLVQITRKLHGTNARYGIVKKLKLSFWDRVKKFIGYYDEWLEYEYVYGSHNVEKGSDSQGFYSTDVWRTVNEAYQIESKLWEYIRHFHIPATVGNGIILYGEIYGAGIQTNYDYGLTDIRFAAFDIMRSGEYLDTHTASVVIKGCLGLDHVDILHDGRWTQEIQDKFVFNNFIEGTKVPHEGIVIKHASGDRTKIAKVINPDYLIYGEKHEVGDSH